MSRRRLQALRRPRRLVPGDRVAVVATSGPVDADRLDRGAAVLRSWGLDVVVGQHVLDRDRHLAGRDEDRAADLQGAWCDPGVVAVLSARGGSGATRLLDRLDWPAMRAAGPKLLVGCSDVTALHEGIAAHLGLVSLFGPMPATAVFGGDAPDAATTEHLRRTLFEPDTVTVVDAATAAVVPGRATGVLTGGTLSLLASTVGTPESRSAAGGIVVLEDVTEQPYRIDSFLTQLLRTGWFDDVRGVALGSWVGCGDEAVETVCARLSGLGVPLLTGLAFGHGRPQLTIPLGVDATLDADAGTLALTRPALA